MSDGQIVRTLIALLVIGFLSIYGWLTLSERYIEPWVMRTVKRLFGEAEADGR